MLLLSYYIHINYTRQITNEYAPAPSPSLLLDVCLFLVVYRCWRDCGSDAMTRS